MRRVPAKWMYNGRHLAHLFRAPSVIETDTGILSECGMAYSGDNPSRQLGKRQKCKICRAIEKGERCGFT